MAAAVPDMSTFQKKALRRCMWEEQSAKCPLCRLRLSLDASPKDPMYPTIDHKYPRSAGGGDERANLQLVHRRCNEAKGELLPDEAA